MASIIEIFFCYAREDEELLKGLEKQLYALKLQGIIDVWHDRQISAGSEWEREIDKHLNSAHIILLLVSPDFMVSSYCYSKEMIRAMERHEYGEACVIPVILRPVYWQGAPFGKLQALPTDAKAVASRYWYNLDEAFYDVAQGIHEAVQTLTSKLAAKAEIKQPLQSLPPVPPVPSPPLVVDSVTETQKMKEKWMEEGRQFRHLKQYTEALTAYEKALRLDPNDALAYGNKGYVLNKLERYEEALVACEQALLLNSKDVVAYVNKGQALNELERYEEALVACEQAIRLDPKNAATYVNKGYALNQLNLYEEALAAYEQAIRLNPNYALAFRNKANTLRILDREKEAQQAYAKARELGYKR
jgi:tetratricopeptide (TPR) repeat protein